MIANEFSLEGRVAIVTGAGRGIGKAIALAMAEAGADITAVARTQSQIEQTAEEIRRLGRRCLTLPTDVTKTREVEEMVAKTFSEWGRIDIMVNDAGTGIRKPIVPLPGFDPLGNQKKEPSLDERTSDEEWDRVIQTNLTSMFLCCRAVGPHFVKAGKGKVINTSSFAGGKGFPYQVCYCTSKAAVNMFTRSLAVEWARYNVNVNAIAPGYAITALTEPIFDEDDATKKRILSSIPLKRFCEARDVALLAVYLAYDASNYITGQIIYIDGGLSA